MPEQASIRGGIEMRSACSNDACLRRAAVFGEVDGELERLPSEIASEITICDGTPCLLTTKTGREAVSAFIRENTGETDAS
ncbi:MAG TPA: hypothetical protein VLE74_02755 [Candidatus Saccharimonadales bacterium]|nr:hypothetical protein [Candidatus Saccharimonadales bacterium]